MNLEEAKIYRKEHENRKCLCEPHNPNTFCYKSIGFLEGYKQCLERMEPIVKLLEEISWGIIESPEDANGIKLVRVREKFELQGFANEALKLFDEIKREVEK